MNEPLDMHSSLPLQLPLDIGLADYPSFDNFHSGAAREALQIVRDVTFSPVRALGFVFGPTGAGKTHLLYAAARAANERGQRVATIPLRPVGGPAGAPTLALLGDLSPLDLVCIDDVDAVLEDLLWERALFNLYNVLEGHATRLIVSARCAPSQLRARLPDLVSRLSSGIAVRLDPLREGDQRRALKARAHHRGFELTDEVLEFLLRRASRDMHSLVYYLDWLEASSLVEKRRVTVPLVREMLTALAADCPTAALDRLRPCGIRR